MPDNTGIIQNHPETRRSQSPADETTLIGDLLIAFRLRGQSVPGRGGRTDWHRTKVGEECELLLQSPAPDWRGFPQRLIEAGQWQFRLLGEVFGTADVDRAVGRFAENPRANELNGHFLLLGHHTETRQWHVWTNRFGTVHAYYADCKHKAAIGTAFHSVASAGARHKLDTTAIQGFFRFGFFPADRTWYEDVRVFLPASHYTFDYSGRLLHSERYRPWSYTPDHSRSYHDTLEEFAHLFEKVMREMMEKGRVAVPISGGLDSRSTVVPLRSSQQNIWSYSYGYSEDSKETDIAREIAEKRSLRFTGFTVKPYLFDRLERVLASVEAFQDVTQCRQAFVVGDISRNADHLIAAHWGDVWMDGMGVAGMMKPQTILSITFEKMKKRGSNWLLENLRTKKEGDPDRALRDILTHTLSEYEGISDPDFRLKALKTDTWSFRWTVPSLRMFQSAAFPRLPFYDIRLADFFSTVPTRFHRGRKLQIDYLKRYAPDLARITWQTYDTNLYRYPFFNSLLLPKRVLQRVLRTITRERVIERNWEVQFSGDQGRTGLSYWLLRPGLRIHEFFPPDSLRSLFTDFHSSAPDPEKGYTVSMLVTFSAFLEKYG